jgi:hypothetical protein
MPCTIYLLSSGQEALKFDDVCYQAPTRADRSRPHVRCNPARYVLREGAWLVADQELIGEAERAKLGRGYRTGAIEIRTVTARRAFIDGEPAGEPFE